MAIATTWLARGREATGLTAVPSALVQTVTLNWSGDAPGLVVGTLPWAAPEYPTLLVYGIGVTITTNGTVASRRLGMTLDDNGHTEWLSAGVQNAGSVRRWELGVGFNFSVNLAGTTFREPLPRGWMLLPRASPGTALTLTISGGVLGDVFGAISIRGHLLFP